jgi:hypothetical protein
MKQSYYLTVAALGILITTAAVGITSFAANPDSNGQNNGFGKPFPIERQQDIRQAITDNNYSAWAESMKQKVQDLRDQADKIEQTINEDTFNKMIAAHQLMADGKTDEAKAIFEELGMKGPGSRQGKGQGGFGNMMPCPNQNSNAGQ